MARVTTLVAESADTIANLALLGDKNLLFNEDRTAFIMYQVSGNSWVAMGDPVGAPRACEELAWDFLEHCDAMAVSPVFYQVKPENLPLYIDLGLNLSKLGEEARVDLGASRLPRGPLARTCGNRTAVRSATRPASKSCRQRGCPRSSTSCARYPTPGWRRRRPRRSASRLDTSMSSICSASTAGSSAVPAPSWLSRICGARARASCPSI